MLIFQKFNQYLLNYSSNKITFLFLKKIEKQFAVFILFPSPKIVYFCFFLVQMTLVPMATDEME